MTVKKKGTAEEGDALFLTGVIFFKGSGSALGTSGEKQVRIDIVMALYSYGLYSYGRI